MRYRELGASGVRVSEVGIGAFPLSGYSTDAEGRRVGWSGASDAQAVALIHRAEELGINLIDSAESYGNGHSERVVGSALRGRRDQWLTATKVTTNLGLRRRCRIWRKPRGGASTRPRSASFQGLTCTISSISI